MKYKKLKVPETSSWDRKPTFFRRYFPIWLKEFVEGIKNIIRWIPTIYKDKDWDQYFIMKLLQKKIEHQREYLIYHNRHIGIEQDNRNMTWVLNLIEYQINDYYELEKYDYVEFGKKLLGPYKSEKLDNYLVKYPGTIRRVKQKYPNINFDNKDRLSLYVGIYNQQKCNHLIWKIMEEKSGQWWD